MYKQVDTDSIQAGDHKIGVSRLKQRCIVVPRDAYGKYTAGFGRLNACRRILNHKALVRRIV